MNRVDRSEAFIRSGRSIIGDRPAPPAPPIVALDGDDFVPKGLRAWAGRSTNGVYVQGLIDADGQTYVTVVFRGRCETREVPREKALDVFEHPFAYGFEL